MGECARKNGVLHGKTDARVSLAMNKNVSVSGYVRVATKFERMDVEKQHSE